MRRLQILAPSILLLLPACTGLPGKGDTADTGPDNVAPALTVDTPVRGSEFDEGEEVRVSGFVVDDFDAAELISVRVATDGAGLIGTVTPSSDGSWALPVTFAEGDTVLRVSALDTMGAETIVDVPISVFDPSYDRPPTRPAIYISPAVPRSGDALEVVIDVASQDPDGLAVTYQYAWTVDGVPYDSETVPALTTFRGQNWTVSVTAFDGTLSSTPGTASVLVVNSPPTADGASVGPPDATPEIPLECRVLGMTDLEGDPILVTYEWTVDGAPAGDGTDRLPPGSAVEGQDIVCTALLDDGIDTTAIVAPTFQFGNAAPGAPEVAIAPSAPDDTDDLTCAVTLDAIDPDGDPVTYSYAWYRDGVYVGDVDATVSASDTTRDEVWTCEVVATDSEGLTGAVGAASVTILPAWYGAESAASAWSSIDGATENGLFGKTVGLLGDMDGDGRSEVAVSAPGEDGGEGRVYLFSGASLGGSADVSDAMASWTGSWTDGLLGGYRALAAPGDMDGDGAAELMFAAPDADANGNGSGIAYLVYGGGSLALDADPDATADYMVVGSANDQAGARITSGDLDADGYADLAVSAPGASDTARGTGTVAIFAGSSARFSGTSVTADADQRIFGDAELDGLGWTLKIVGDVDGDGYDDLFTTAMYADAGGSESGTGGLFLGSSTISGTSTLSTGADALFYGDAAGDRFGYDVIGQSDVDGDGYDDLVIAEYQDDSGATDGGTIRTFLGRGRWASAYGTDDADGTVQGTEANARFGHVMGAPGDLDGDGTDDLVIGALFASPSGLTYQGAAFVVLGPDLLRASTTEDLLWRSEGEAASDLYGDAVSFGRGDVDGDGRNDVAVGAQGHDSGGSASGRVYVWRGR